MGVNHVEFSNGETVVDLRQDTINPDVVLEGYTGHDAQGNPFDGRLQRAGETVQEVFWVDCSFDLATTRVLSFSTTFQEIKTALGYNKLAKLKVALLGLNIIEYGDVTFTSQDEIDFSILTVSNLGAGYFLYHFNVALFADDTNRFTMRTVDATTM